MGERGANMGGVSRLLGTFGRHFEWRSKDGVKVKNFSSRHEFVKSSHSFDDE